MPWLGPLLLGIALALIVTSGWPTYAVLLAVATAGSAIGLAVGAIDLGVIGSLPVRILGLLENDLLQGLALYALVGAFLRELGWMARLHESASRVFGRRRSAASAVASLSMGALLAPVNGSVGASVVALSRHGTAEADVSSGSQTARASAVVAVASTLGVVVPPSLVLLLLGDAMMRAHTEGLHLARDAHLPLAATNLRIVNTQDVMQAIWLPAGLLLAGWLVVAWIQGQRSTGAESGSSSPLKSIGAVAAVPLLILALMGLVASGHVRAIEGAAAFGCLLLAIAATASRWPVARWRAVFDDAAALTGSLFALLVAATTFSLLLRGLGTDRWITHGLLSLQAQPMHMLAMVIGLLLVCGLVLDAFELIFLVIPIVMPPLLAVQSDAAWVAVLALLALQLGFLMPPFGYAVVLVRARRAPAPAIGAMVLALAPYLGWLTVTFAAVAIWPQMTTLLRSAPATLDLAEPVGDIDELMRRMAPPPERASNPAP